MFYHSSQLEEHSQNVWHNFALIFVLLTSEPWKNFFIATQPKSVRHLLSSSSVASSWESFLDFSYLCLHTCHPKPCQSSAPGPPLPQKTDSWTCTRTPDHLSAPRRILTLAFYNTSILPAVLSGCIWFHTPLDSTLSIMLQHFRLDFRLFSCSQRVTKDFHQNIKCFPASFNPNPIHVSALPTELSLTRETINIFFHFFFSYLYLALLTHLLILTNFKAPCLGTIYSLFPIRHLLVIINFHPSPSFAHFYYFLFVYKLLSFY